MRFMSPTLLAGLATLAIVRHEPAAPCIPAGGRFQKTFGSRLRQLRR